MTQSNRSPISPAPERNEPGLDNLVNQVSKMIPTCKLDKNKKDICLGSVPAEGHYDARSSLNERNGITEGLGNVHGTTSQGSSQEEVVTKGSGPSHFGTLRTRGTPTRENRCNISTRFNRTHENFLRLN